MVETTAEGLQKRYFFFKKDLEISIVRLSEPQVWLL